MMTLKIKYECDEVQEPLVSYRRQYSSCLRFAYNRFLEGKSVDLGGRRIIKKV